MVLTFDSETKKITGFGSYEHRDTLKFHGCMWDKDNKSWYVPETVDVKLIIKIIKQINETERQNSIKKWTQACEEMGHSIVKKGSPEYNQVLTKFKTLNASS